MPKEGWIKLHRCSLDNPIVCKDSDYFSVWCYLLLNATHQKQDKIFNGNRITLKNGQLITGRKAISEQFNIDESKVQRILKTLESEQQIEQQTCNKNRLISIVNWELYQQSEQQNEQQVNNNCTTSEQQVNTNKNERKKELKNVKKRDIGAFAPPTLDEVRSYCIERKNSIEPERFIDFYQSKGWMVGKTKMKDWKSALRGWESRDSKPTSTASPPKKQNRFVNFEQRKWDFDVIEEFERNRE